jgi:hypothetical protein
MPLTIATLLVALAGCGGSPATAKTVTASGGSGSVEAKVAKTIEDACIFHVKEGVGINDCYVGFERVKVTDCQERDPSDGGGKYDCIAEDLVTGQRAEVRVIDAFDDLGEPDSTAVVVNADDVR